MKRILIVIAAFALLVAACGGSSDEGVASLSNTDSTVASDAAEDETDAADEDILLEFAACMRENGADDFEDPTFDAEGRPEFTLRGGTGGGDGDRETMQAAFETCQDHLEGLAFGPGSVDLTEVQDTLVEFAACMRDNGYDMPDPDLSGFADRGNGNGGGGPFGEIDPDDPSFVSALGECEDIFANLPFVGGGRGPGGRGGNG